MADGTTSEQDVKTDARPGSTEGGERGGRSTDEASDRAWHLLEPDEAVDRVESSRDGLSEDEAKRRLDEHGENRLGEARSVSPWRVLLHQFQSPLIYVLLGALVVTVVTSLVTGEGRWADAIVIGIVLLVNGTIGFIQEYRAEHAVESLMAMVAPKAWAKRDGTFRQVEAHTLVPGDVVRLSEGGVVPADVRLLDVSALRVNEAALTGESAPVTKQAGALEDADLTPADQLNMAFMGTAVTSGRGEGVIVATAKQTELGQIAEQVEQAGETQTPLERRIHRLAVWITVGILIIAAAAMGVGKLMGRGWVEMITLAIALAVAAIPAGLPIVVTVALAIGVRRMAKRHAVIRKLPAVDTLGSCSAIVSDKTGTLTQNRMRVRALVAGGRRYDVTWGEESGDGGGLRREGESASLAEETAAALVIAAGLRCNDAELGEGGVETDGDDDDRRDAERGGEPDGERGGEEASGSAEPAGDEDSSVDRGDPMEIALLRVAGRVGLDAAALGERFERVDEQPFRTEARFMATVDRDHGGEAEEAIERGASSFVWVKGAPEQVASMCDRAVGPDGEESEFDAGEVERWNESLADEGLRVLAMAMGRGDEAASSVKRESPSGLTFLGLTGLMDPPRDSAREAVDACHRSGIRVLMVTGDHARTAAAIADRVHVDRPPHAGRSVEEVGDAPERWDEVTTGRDATELDDEALDEALGRSNVFARVKPVQKTRIVDRLMAGGEVVAVTGDGVNDAPALKRAHLGAAMGSGTDVAREASDMVITDDHFASVYAAVEQGRTAFRNIRMATFFLLSTGAADVLIILIALGFDWALPLLPAQILWCNVVTNGIADVALAFEPGEEALYRRKPRPLKEGVLDGRLLERLVLVGVWLAVGVLGVFLWKWGFDFASWSGGDEDRLTLAQTAALTTLVLFQKVHVFNCRSEDVSIFKIPLTTNKLLLGGVLASLVVHIAAVYTPFMQELLSLEPLDAMTWLVAGGVASTAIIVNELHKKLRPRRVA